MGYTVAKLLDRICDVRTLWSLCEPSKDACCEINTAKVWTMASVWLTGG